MPSKKQRAKMAKATKAKANKATVAPTNDAAVQQALEEASIARQHEPSDPTSLTDEYIMKVTEQAFHHSTDDQMLCPSCNESGTRAYACTNATLHMMDPKLGTRSERGTRECRYRYAATTGSLPDQDRASIVRQAICGQENA